MKEITATPSTRRRRPEAVCHVCRPRHLRPSVAKCISREADRGDGVGAEQRPLGFWDNDRGRRASPGPLSGQRKPRPRLSTWVGTASSCTKLPGHVLAPVKPLGRARADAFAPCGAPSDLVDGRGELYWRARGCHSSNTSWRRAGEGYEPPAAAPRALPLRADDDGAGAPHGELPRVPVLRAASSSSATATTPEK